MAWHVNYEKNDSLRLAPRCLPALVMVPSSDVTETFFILAGNMPGSVPDYGGVEPVAC